MCDFNECERCMQDDDFLDDCLCPNSIDEVWEIADTNDFLVAMSAWLSKKCDYGENLSVLSPAEKTFFLNLELESEVNNGGFFQYLYNTSGAHLAEAVQALQMVGAQETAKIAGRVLAALGGKLPHDRDEREQFLEGKITDQIEQLVDDCDEAFYQYPDDLEVLNYQFAAEKRPEFG